jgi:hypothetical protein
VATKTPPHSPFDLIHGIVAGVVFGSTVYDVARGAPALSHAAELQLIGMAACLAFLIFWPLEMVRRWRDARRRRAQALSDADPASPVVAPIRPSVDGTKSDTE